MSSFAEPSIIAELLSNCSRSKRRHSVWSRERPTDWRPHTVVDPRSPEGHCFTDNAAWDYIVERLQAGELVEIITLDKPVGKKGYVMKIEQPNKKIIYIKLQLFSPPGVIGRSFHYSYE